MMIPVKHFYFPEEDPPEHVPWLTVKAKSTEKREPAPDGYHWGAYDNGPGWSGRYLIRDADGQAIVVKTAPEHPALIEQEDAVEAEFVRLFGA